MQIDVHTCPVIIATYLATTMIFELTIFAAIAWIGPSFSAHRLSITSTRVVSSKSVVTTNTHHVTPFTIVVGRAF